MLDENVFVALDRPESIKLHENYKEDIGQGFSSESLSHSANFYPMGQKRRDNSLAEICPP